MRIFRYSTVVGSGVDDVITVMIKGSYDSETIQKTPTGPPPSYFRSVQPISHAVVEGDEVLDNK